MAAILENQDPSCPCVYSHVQLTPDADLARPCKKHKPFATIGKIEAVHTLDLVLPEDAWEIVKQELDREVHKVRYYQVSMTLLQIVSGEFYNEYIKKGNILMMSEGRQHIDDRFSLKNGILRLEIEKAVYERLGLVGKPLISVGRKHMKHKFAVDINMRLPCMVRGKRSFEKVIQAFERTLTHTIKWLFVNLQSEATTLDPVVEQHSAKLCIAGHSPPMLSNILAPFPQLALSCKDRVYEQELLEWLGLLTIDSPRVSHDDKINKYLCRYELPQHFSSTQLESQKMVHIRWRGLVISRFIMGIFALLTNATENSWFALISKSFEGKGYTTLSSSRSDIMIWEY